MLVYGYSVFFPGRWDVSSFFTYYTMVLVAPATVFGWKLTKKTKFIKPHEADLVWERPEIDAYESVYEGVVEGFWRDMLNFVRRPFTRK